jgi:2-polyprenyl-3-methyl-5-hydroxy-6-metoxy-1,4-benzoquinol methylase
MGVLDRGGFEIVPGGERTAIEAGAVIALISLSSCFSQLIFLEGPPMYVSNLPSPTTVTASLTAYQTSAALKSAIEIDLFTAIAEGHQTPEALAARCKVHPRGARILADFLVIMGHLTKQGRTYGLPVESRLFLDRRSPHYIGRTVEFLQASFVWAQFGQLTQWVREGGARSQDNALNPNHEVWVTFARAMAVAMTRTAEVVAPIIKGMVKRRTHEPLKVLDVAAGHGMFGIEFAKIDPTCRVVAQDWPEILVEARQNAIANGVADRFSMLAGDIMQIDMGSEYDVVLIPNLIHYLDRASAVGLLKRVRAAMAPGGLVAIAEFAPNEDRVSPAYGGFALFALATTPAGDAYTVNEILAMCAEAGFAQPSAWDVGQERLMAAVNPEITPPLIVSGPRWSVQRLEKPLEVTA